MPYTPENNPYMPGDPYSYDLKWVVDQIKYAISLYEPLHNEFEDLQSDFEFLRNYVDNYFDTLDVSAEVTEAVNNILTDWYSSGYLLALLQPSLNDMNAQIAQQNDDIDVLSARMDTFASLTEGSTTADAELMDIRVGADGITYPTAGDAVRGQVSNLNEVGADTYFIPMTTGSPYYGVSRVKNSDGSYTFSGTPTQSFSLAVGSFPVQAGRTYYYELSSNGINETDNVYVFLIGVPSAPSTWIRDSHFIFKATTSTTVNLRILVNDAVVGTNISLTVKPHYNLHYSNAELSDYIDDILSIKDLYDFSEVGNINAADPSTWGPNPNRVCRMQRYPLKLHKGDIIGLTDYSNARMYVIWTDTAGAWHFKGWITYGEFIVPEDGNYWYNLDYVPAHAVTDKSELLSLLHILKKTDRLAEFTDTIPVIQRNEWIYNAINHRGYNLIAPENTLPAFILSAKMGFKAVESDIRFTSDDIPVMLHDTTINRTARNNDGTEIDLTIDISDITYAQALQYDFGIWKDAAYAGTRIPTFEEFVKTCKQLGLHIYLDFHYETESRIRQLGTILKRYDMLKYTTWIHSSTSAPAAVAAIYPSARVGLLIGQTLTASIVNILNSYKTGSNEVVAIIFTPNADADAAGLLADEDIPMEVYTPNNFDYADTCDPYISGFISDYWNYGKISAEKLISTSL